jgi:hypothetical protein
MEALYRTWQLRVFALVGMILLVMDTLTRYQNDAVGMIAPMVAGVILGYIANRWNDVGSVDRTYLAMGFAVSAATLVVVLTAAPASNQFGPFPLAGLAILLLWVTHIVTRAFEARTFWADTAYTFSLFILCGLVGYNMMALLALLLFLIQAAAHLGSWLASRQQESETLSSVR